MSSGSEKEKTSKYLQELLNTYAKHSHLLGNTFETSLLSAFTALVALKLHPSIKLDYQSANNATMIRQAIQLLEESYTQPLHINDVLTISYEHIALHHFLLQSIELEINESDYLKTLDWIISQSGHIFAESVTPPTIADLMVRLVKIENGQTILDPAMGTGGFLKAIQRGNPRDVLFQGIEINQKLHFVTLLYGLIKKDTSTHLILGSAFAVLHQKSFTNVDVVLCNPPIKKMPLSEAKGRYSHLLNSPYISSETSLNFIELALEHLRPGGRAAFLVHMHPLFALGDIQMVREHWVEHGLLNTVISLPSKLLAHTGLKCAVLLFNKDINNRKRTVKLVNAYDCFTEERGGKRHLSETNITEILNRIISHDASITKQVTYTELQKNDFNLVPDQYLDRHFGAVNFNLSKTWQPLGELAQIIQGRNLSRLPEGNDPIIQGRNLRVEKMNIGHLEKKDLKSYSKPIYRTQRNDILLQRIGTSPAAYYVKASEEGIAVANTVFIIRFAKLDPDLIGFIAQFLNSDEGTNRINQMIQHSVVPTQSIKRIQQIKVPLPDKKVISLVHEMTQIEQALKNEYIKASQLKKSVFGNFDETDLTDNFNKVRLTSHALENALSQKDDIEYKIRNSYPFPIAFAYRHIYTEREYSAIYDRQMKFGEHLLSFLASIGICLVKEYEDHLNESIDELLNFLQENSSRGLSPGHWRDLLKKSCTLLRNVDFSAMANEFSSLWFKGSGKKESKFASLTESELVNKHNNHKHSRGPVNVHEYKLAVEEQKEVLRNLLDELEFFTQWDLILVDDTDINWKRQETEYRISLLKGDHPAFESSIIHSKKALSKEKLYMKYDDELVCLHPMLSYIYNLNTKKQEIFSLDKKNKFKSFDSGTTIENVELSSDFIFWIEN